jgi:hypothetical protein
VSVTVPILIICIEPTASRFLILIAIRCIWRAVMMYHFRIQQCAERTPMVQSHIAYICIYINYPDLIVVVSSLQNVFESYVYIRI